jgi:hypothetical protein
MVVYVCMLVLALNTLITSAFKVSFKQAKRSLHQEGTAFSVSRSTTVLSGSTVLAAASGDNGLDLNSVHDLIYLSNITIGGTPYVVQLDTGSSDLWVKGDPSPLPNTNETLTTYNLTYGIGWAFGHVSYGPVQFAGVSVSNQAFLHVSDAHNPALGYGANGILGLGFTSLSTIDALVNKTSESTGRSLLFNLFQDNPSQPNFIAFSLQRDSDSTDDIQGSFSVGEYEPKYAGVANTAPIPTWPVSSPSRWNVLVESFIVHGKTVPVTSMVTGAPTDTAVALLDSGSSYSYAPKYVCDAIYSQVAGARFDSALGQWIVPCGTEIDMALQIAGQIFPIHPLDMTPNGVVDTSICVGSFVPQSLSIGSGQFDWLIGDNFLRAVYSIYDFGDYDSSNQMGNPYVKLLSLVDPNDASADFHQVRGGTPSTNITYNASGGSSDSPSAVITLSDKVAKSLNLVAILIPAMLAVMALNALVILIIIIAGLVYCRRRKKSGNVGRMTNSLRRTLRNRRMSGNFHRMSAMPTNPTISVTGEPEPNHPYEPVSMAMTEDTVFNTPTTAFHKWEGVTMRPGVDRPQTTIFTGVPPIGPALSSPATHRASVARTEGITANMDHTPPSPAFFRMEQERPRSRSTSLVNPPAMPSPLSPTSQRSSTANSESLTEGIDYTPPSPGFFQVEHDGQRTALVTPPPPTVLPPPSPSSRSQHSATSRHSNLSVSRTEDITEGAGSPALAPGFLQPGQEATPLLPTTSVNLPPPMRLPPPLPANHRMSVARTEGITGDMEFRRPMPGFMQGDRPRSMV